MSLASLFIDKVSPHGADWSGTHCVDQAALDLVLALLPHPPKGCWMTDMNDEPGFALLLTWSFSPSNVISALPRAAWSGLCGMALFVYLALPGMGPSVPSLCEILRKLSSCQLCLCVCLGGTLTLVVSS